MPPQRILIDGVTGSGKTTFARRLSELIGVPWHSIDDLTWEPGWVEVPDDLQRQRVESVCSGERWIIDAAYARWIDVPLARVELIVGLDYPRLTSLCRLVLRTVSRVVDKSNVCNGNVETWRNFAGKDSIVAWHFKSFAKKRKRMREWAAKTTGPDVVLLSSPRRAEDWLRGARARWGLPVPGDGALHRSVKCR